MVKRRSQLPKLCFRGGVVNITMKNCTPDQRAVIEEQLERVKQLKGVNDARHALAKRLAEPIGGAYAENRQAGLQEADITLWRAVAEIRYHRHYNFKCANCGAKSYKTQQGKTRLFDQIFPNCKACKCYEIVDPKGTNLLVGEFVTLDRFQEITKDLADHEEPEVKSPILALPGPKKHDHERIFNDPEESTKLLNTFLSGMRAQILKENARTKTKTEPQTIIERADKVVIEEILCLMEKHRVYRVYHEFTQPERGWFRINFNTWAAPIEFIAGLGIILQKAEESDVDIRITDRELAIRETLSAPTISGVIVKPEHVFEVDNSSTYGEDGDGAYTINSVTARTIRGGITLDTVDHTEVVECKDWMDSIEKHLPDGLARQIFDLLIQRGQSWLDFSKEYGDKPARISHIAQFLKTNRKQVVENRAHIMLNMLRGMCETNRYHKLASEYVSSGRYDHELEQAIRKDIEEPIEDSDPLTLETFDFTGMLETLDLTVN